MTLRCAIYTRVSTESGLDQEFNSLHNQREAAEAYVKSQAHEGWSCLPGRYDDGGFSGGSMGRPGLQRLLTEIRARLIDVVVVYKVDRLTRSLADFAKLVELFDANRVSFVSVTQAFNTTTSMGRLTLNVLLSFAQFEREVTGERIRDKIAASKRKGLWMGGVVPLGYRVEARKLLVDDTEAITVRLIFERYLALGSLPALQADLRERGISSRKRILSSGETIGGVPFTNGPLGHLLRNRMYLGDITHKGLSFPGEHLAIVSTEIFAAVQDALTARLNRTSETRSASGALLLGRLQDDRRHRMTPSTVRKGALRHRYYVSCVLAQGRKAEAGTIARVAAQPLETAIVARLRQFHPDDRHLTDAALVKAHLKQAMLGRDRIDLTFADDTIQTIAWTPPSSRRRREIMPGGEIAHRPMKPDVRTMLLKQIASGRLWLAQVMHGQSAEVITARDGISRRQVERSIALAFLAPDLIRAATRASLPRGISARALLDAPMSWAEQRMLFGIRE